MLLPSGNPIKCHEEVLSLQPMIPPKRFDIFLPCLGDAQKVWMRPDIFLTIDDQERTHSVLVTNPKIYSMQEVDNPILRVVCSTGKKRMRYS